MIRQNNINLERIEIKWLALQLGVRRNVALALTAVAAGHKTARRVHEFTGIPVSKTYDLLKELIEDDFVFKEGDEYLPNSNRIEKIVTDSKKFSRSYVDYITELTDVAVKRAKLTSELEQLRKISNAKK